MKKTSFGLLVALFVSSPAFASEEKSAAPNPSATLFSKNCASCHGADAHGKATMAKALKVELSALDLLSAKANASKDEELRAVVEKGHGKMPAYGKKLSAIEITGLLGFLHSLRETGKKDKD